MIDVGFARAKWLLAENATDQQILRVYVLGLR